MLESWERIFDPRWFGGEIQAVFELLELKDVVSAVAYGAKVRN
jgi:hypothetical protein